MSIIMTMTDIFDRNAADTVAMYEDIYINIIHYIPGFSTLITSAPMSPRFIVQNGPARILKSSYDMPYIRHN